jgi:rhomboid family protein
MFPKRQLQPFTRRWAPSRPSAWAILVAANVGCFVAQSVIQFSRPDFIQSWLALSREGVLAGYAWQFFSYMFLHGDLSGPPALAAAHLFLNVVMLYFVAREIETILGAKHLLAIYFGGGVLGGLAQVALSPAPVLGSSAGVLAVLIALTTMLPEIEVQALLFFIIPVRLKAKHLTAIVFGLAAALALARTPASIAHWAHLGGCVFGWLYVRQLGYGNPLRVQRYFLEKRRRAERIERMPPEQFMSEEIDPILEKISRDGIRSLTRAERKILEKGREKIAKKTAAPKC